MSGVSNANDPSADIDEAHLFLDTNILLHYPALDGLAWHSKVNASTIFLHISEPVLEEIAKKKDMGETKRLRKRSDRLVKRITEMIEHEELLILPSGEHVVIDSATPKMESFRELNPMSADDRLLAAALTFQNSTGFLPIVVTADVSLALRAKLRGYRLQNLTIDDTDRLPEEPDRDEVEKRQLQQRVEILTASQPMLTVHFRNGGSVFHLEEREAPAEDLFSAALQEAKNKLPYATLEKSDPGSVTLDFFNQQEVNNYNAALDEFFSDYHHWLLNCKKFVDRSHEIVIEVLNSGKCPAFGVYLRLYFPDGLILIEKDKFDELLPEEPVPPEKPRDWLSRLGDFRIPITGPHFPDIKPIFASENMSIEKTNSFKVEWDSKKIRQGETKSLIPMLVVYDSDPFSFEIPFELVADNLTSAMTGSLHVRIDKST